MAMAGRGLPPEVDWEAVPWVAERELRTLDGGRVRVRLGRPFPLQGREDEFCCPVEVTGLPLGDERRIVIGIDSLQALLLGATHAGNLVSDPALSLSWLGDEDLGFPTVRLALRVEL